MIDYQLKMKIKVGQLEKCEENSQIAQNHSIAIQKFPIQPKIYNLFTPDIIIFLY